LPLETSSLLTGSYQTRQRLTAVAAVLLITLAGVAIRTLGLDRPLWADERATLRLVGFPVAELALRPLDETPFLYYALHKLLLGGPTSPAHARILAFAAGVFAVPLIYFPARILAGRNAAIMAVALLAFWPLHVQYSQEARAHSLLFLVVLLSLTGFLCWLDRTASDSSALERRSALAFFGLFTLLAFYVHLLAIFWLAIVMPVFAVRVAGLSDRRREGLLCLALMAIGALPGMHWLWLRLGGGHEYHWLQQATPLQAASLSVAHLAPPLQAAIREAVTGELGIPPVLVALLFLLSAFSLGVALTGAPKAMARLAGPPHAAAVLVGLAMVPLLLWVVGAAFPILSSRNMAWAGSGPILLWILLLAEVSARRLRLGRIRSHVARPAHGMLHVSAVLYGRQASSHCHADDRILGSSRTASTTSYRESGTTERERARGACFRSMQYCSQIV